MRIGEFSNQSYNMPQGLPKGVIDAWRYIDNFNFKLGVPGNLVDANTLKALKQNLDYIHDWVNLNGSADQKKVINEFYDKCYKNTDNMTYPVQGPNENIDQYLTRISKMWDFFMDPTTRNDIDRIDKFIRSQ